MKKEILPFCLMILLSFSSLCGCGVTDSKVKKEACEYIENKYNHDARIISVKKNYKFTGPGGGQLPTGVESDESYNLIMEMEGRKFDVCLLNAGLDVIGYDNYEEYKIKADVLDEIESQLNINCEEIFLSYGEIYEKYGSNMIHAPYSDLAQIYENGRFAIIIATYDSINPDYVEKYATKYNVQDEKSILRIEILQYKDFIPKLGFSSFSEVNDSQYVLDWYSISKGEIYHYYD